MPSLATIFNNFGSLFAFSMPRQTPSWYQNCHLDFVCATFYAHSILNFYIITPLGCAKLVLHEPLKGIFIPFYRPRIKRKIY